jgi:large subunit ribosomal protein L5
MARLKEIYKSKVVPQLVEEFNYDNPMAIPKIRKVIVSMGVGRAVENEKILDSVKNDLMNITGQMPVETRAKRSVSNFNLRAGQKIGLKVTLRRERMFEFVDRLISLAIPRIRDFRGLNPKSFDGNGNYTMGIQEQTAFPEVEPAKIEYQQGMDITFVTSAETNEEAHRMLSLLGMPFKKPGAKD